MSVIGPCWSCGRTFAFSAERVPSILIEGVRQPVCRACMELANAKRIEAGRDPHPILPGAYEPEEI